MQLDFESPFKEIEVMPELEKYFNMDIDLKDPDLEERLRNMLKSAFPRKFKERMNEK